MSESACCIVRKQEPTITSTLQIPPTNVKEGDIPRNSRRFGTRDLSEINGGTEKAIAKLQTDLTRQITAQHEELLREVSELRLLFEKRGIDGGTGNKASVMNSSSSSAKPVAGSSGNEKFQGGTCMTPNTITPSTSPQVVTTTPTTQNNQAVNAVKLEHREEVKAARKRSSKLHDAYLNLKGWQGKKDHDQKHKSLLNEEAEPTKGCFRRLKRVVSSVQFNLFFGMIIIINAGVMGAQMEYKGYKAAITLGLAEGDASDWPDAQSTFDALELVFTVVFLFELLIRLVADPKFLCEILNWLDVVVVLTSVLGLFGLTLPVNLTFARLLRIAKLVRILRVVRTMNLFQSLRVLVKTISGSIGALGWSMVLLGLIQIIGALFLSQVLHDVIENESRDMETRMHVYTYYGSALRAWLTMFEITFAPGAWAKVGRPLMEEVHGAYSLFFVAYVAGVTFAIIRVITAVFLRETLQVASNDSELAIASKLTQKNKYKKEVQQLFTAADKSGDGHVSLPEFEQILENPNVKTWLSVLELEVHEVDGLFHLLDNGDGYITFEEFLAGVVRLKGAARSVDVMTMLYENQKMTTRILQLQEDILNIRNRLQYWEDNGTPTSGNQRQGISLP